MKEQILVIGDHHVVRNALRQRLELAFPAYQVIEADNRVEAVALARRQPLRVTVIDMGWVAKVWLDVVRQIKTVQPSAPVVVWAMYDGDNYRRDALAAGATAYVLKQETEDKLLSILRATLQARDVKSSPG